MLRSLVIIAMLAQGCGGAEYGLILLPTILQQQQKTECSDAREFRVCLSAESSFADIEVERVIIDALAELNTLVNSEEFLTTLGERASNGAEIGGELVGTNYIARIRGFCDAGAAALAEAEVNGFDISYNECTIDRASDGSFSRPHVAGVLLHEISHNIGYSHASENPDPDSVPFFLGDLAEELLSPVADREEIRQKENRPWKRFGRTY